MKNETTHISSNLLGIMLENFYKRYPDIDQGTIAVMTQVKSLARSISADINRELVAYGLTESKFNVLLYLLSEDIAGNPLPSPSEIASALSVTRGTITGLLDGLERDDYIQRHNDQIDRRSLTISLTQKGRDFFDHFVPTTSFALCQKVPLTNPEKVQMVQWLSQIETILTP